jgi:hypothetical protein
MTLAIFSPSLSAFYASGNWIVATYKRSCPDSPSESEASDD